MPVKQSRAKTATAKATSAKSPKRTAAKGLSAKPQKTVVKKPAAAKPKANAKPKADSGLPEQMRDAALKVLEDRQGEDILTVDLRGKSPLADYIIIASGRSARQLAAIAEYLREAFAKLGARKLQVEGLPQGDWVLIDGGDVLIHLFRPEVRTYYQIETIWGTPPATPRKSNRG